MSAFIDQAKEVLSAEKITRLELLARKSADFDTNSDEDKEFMELKQEVKKLVANRDRQKNLAMLKDGAYDLKDILAVMGIDKKQAIQAINEFYPKDESNAPKFAGVLAAYGTEDVTLEGRMTKAIGKLIADGGEKTFVENLTDGAKEWIVQSYLSEKGPYKGQQIYGNLNFIATKFKFNKETLKKELGLIKAEQKAPAPVDEKKEAPKKQEAKKAA